MGCLLTKHAIALSALLALAGCHAHRTSFAYESRVGAGSGGTSSGASVSLASDSRLLAGIIVAVMVADGVRYYLQRPDGSMAQLERAPGPDPSRRVSEQDCSQPIVPDGGNLRCR